MVFLVTLLLTLLIVAVVLLVFIKLGPPVYLLEKQNVVKFLTLVVEGRATENDWEVFVGVPIRHNPILENIRIRCCEISETEYLGGGRKFLLTEKGIADVKQLLDNLMETNGD